VIDVRTWHAEKSASPMLVTLLGIETEVRDVQSRKAPCPMHQSEYG
jgi:hypothetical protein